MEYECYIFCTINLLQNYASLSVIGKLKLNIALTYLLPEQIDILLGYMNQRAIFVKF